MREEKSIVGLGFPGMAGALIGNNNRRGGSIMVMGETADIRNGYGTIGWGVKEGYLRDDMKR